jgi:hypothetical protein
MPVFVSHSHDDQAAYTALCLALDGQRIPRWDVEKMDAGQPLAAQLKTAIQKCEACIFLATRRSLDSRWCLAELGAFWGAGKPVIIYVADPEITEADHPPQFHGNLWTSDARRLVDTIRPLVRSTDDRAETPREDTSADEYDIARQRVLEYLTRKDFRMVSFAAIREFIDPEYSDEFLLAVIRRFHSEFRLGKIKGGKQGLGLL